MTKTTTSDDPENLLTEVAIRLDELSDEIRDIPELRDLSDKISDALGILYPTQEFAAGGMIDASNLTISSNGVQINGHLLTTSTSNIQALTMYNNV